MTALSHLALFAAVALSATAALSQAAPTAVDPKVEVRAESLLHQMTLDEKLGQLSQIFWYKGVPDDRIRKGELGSYLFLTDPQEIDRVQHIAVEQSRLHIPLIIGFDVIHGFRTIFPVPLAQAASWDLDLNREIQSAAADEASAAGINWAFAPMVDIARDARWGRMVEGPVKTHISVARWPSRACRVLRETASAIRTIFWPAPNTSPAMAQQ